jgi:hypothetical protein
MIQYQFQIIDHGIQQTNKNINKKKKSFMLQYQIPVLTMKEVHVPM